jgi:site-specific recombinase XerD
MTAQPTLTKLTKPRPVPWNKGRTALRVRALDHEEAREIFFKLSKQKRVRDSVLFALVYDGALRGCEVTKIKIETVWRDSAPIIAPTIESRTIYLSQAARTALTKYIMSLKEDHVKGGWLFKGSGEGNLTGRQYARLFKEWCEMINTGDELSTESLRRSKAQTLLSDHGELDAARRVLGVKNFKDLMKTLDVPECNDLEASINFASL